MIYLDEKTDRPTLECAAIDADFDLDWIEAATDADILAALREWIEAGNEAR